MKTFKLKIMYLPIWLELILKFMIVIYFIIICKLGYILIKTILNKQK